MHIRRRFFQQNPLCVMCLAKRPQRITRAVRLDHIQALINGGTDTEDNRQGLFLECHADKTRADMGHKKKPTIGPDGWPED